MAPSPTLRRLLKETAELSTTAPNPNPAFHAAPVSDSDLHEWHFTLLGPPAPSPYAGGLYHGRITLPASYPLKPPNFRFLTPSGRFETNREICLSISGFHEETWMPAWGVRTALTALRSFMAEKGTAGQVGGLEASTEVRERLARESRRWKCDACGGVANEEIMVQWWAACREQGVRVEEDMGLESLPEGMNLEAREPRPDSKHGQSPSSTTDLHEHLNSTLAEPLATQPVESDTPTSQARPEQQLDNISDRSSPAGTSSSNPPTTTSTTSSPTPTPTITRQVQAPPPIPAEDPVATITIDRAITAVVIALVFMILKKIFYPAANPMEDFMYNDG